MTMHWRSCSAFSPLLTCFAFWDVEPDQVEPVFDFGPQVHKNLALPGPLHMGNLEALLVNRWRVWLSPKLVFALCLVCSNNSLNRFRCFLKLDILKCTHNLKAYVLHICMWRCTEENARRRRQLVHFVSFWKTNFVSILQSCTINHLTS